MKKVLYTLLGLFAAGLTSLYLYVDSIEDRLFPPQVPVPLAVSPRCDATGFQLPENTRLTAVEKLAEPTAHCHITGVIDTEINFELLLPDAWNGKFAMGGGGGFVGSVVNMAQLYGAAQSGYATIGTDTGHAAHSRDGSWALNNPERIENFGHRAVHLTAVTGKTLTADYYGQASRRNYFVGCSRGGGQALMEVQRYPEDFDGVVAGAPAYNWSIGVGANATQIARGMFPDPGELDRALIQPADQALIERHYLAQCDRLDGIEDGILTDPRDCPFDPHSLRCEASSAGHCLDDRQLAALDVLYNGAFNSSGRIYPGYPLGGETSEQGMTYWKTGGLAHVANKPGDRDENGHLIPHTPNSSFGFGNEFMKYMVFHDSDWDYSRYDYDRVFEDTAAAAAVMDATDPDLDRFRSRGGKLLMYHGWSDMALSANATIAYFEDVLARDPSAAEDVKLYMMPGVDHCIGGRGPSMVNWLTEIDQWLEGGHTPEAIEAQWLKWMILPWGSRLVCPYPQVPVFTGDNPRDADSFACNHPE